MPSISAEWKSGNPAPGWRGILRPEFSHVYMKQLVAFLDEERRHYRLLPDPENIFRAFTLTDFNEVRVVILGQDPYPTPGHANGLAFSVSPGVAPPRSLQNIYREIQDDLGIPPRRDGCLERWAEQGVFLLNSSLTVRAGQSNSHAGKGWEQFTQRAIDALAERPEPLVFILWGRNARERGRGIDRSRHLVLESAHPSPMSADRGFFGCRHFSRANEFLREHGHQPIDW
ncbi:MAG: uracil-DNA glycosylase [Candidatus Sumerlaeia bacterium]|nr:uracil-DNA glycosylase [Candidatus Sumerlaeia bacterium]